LFLLKVSIVCTRVSQPGSSATLEGHGAVPRGPRAKAFTKYLCRDIAKPKTKLGVLLMSRGHKFWESLEGGHKPWKVQNHWLIPQLTSFP